MEQPLHINDILQNMADKKPTSKESKNVKQKLTFQQIDNLNLRLERLVPQFKKAIKNKNIIDAKVNILDLQVVLRTLGKISKIVEYKNQLFELAIENYEYDYAIDGFLSNRTLINKNTRLHLEATAWGDGLKAFGIGAVKGALGAAIGYGGFGMDAGFNALWAGYGSAGSVIGSIATGIGSSFIPAIPFGDNFSVSPSFAFGSTGLSTGLTASARFGKFNLSASFSNTGNNSRYSYGGGYGSFAYYRNKFTGDNPQSTGTFAYNSPKFSLSWENDLFGISGEGKKDRWRTNGIGFSVQLNNGNSIGLGTTLMTGEDNDVESTRYPNEHSENASTLRRQGLFYATYKSAIGQEYSAGVNNERWRYGFHKAVHSVTGDGVFSNLRNSYPSTGFVRYGNANPFTYFY